MILTMLYMACTGSSYSCDQPNVSCLEGAGDNTMNSNMDSEGQSNSEWTQGEYEVDGYIVEDDCEMDEVPSKWIVENTSSNTQIDITWEEYEGIDDFTLVIQDCILENNGYFGCQSTDTIQELYFHSRATGQLGENSGSVTLRLECDSNDDTRASTFELSLWY